MTTSTDRPPPKRLSRTLASVVCFVVWIGVLRSVGRLHRLAYGVTVWCLLVVAVVLCSPSLHRQCMRHMAWNQGGREPLNAEGVRGLVEQAGALADDAVMAGYARRCLLLAMDVYAAAAEEGQPALVLQAGIWSELFDDVTG